MDGCQLPLRDDGRSHEAVLRLAAAPGSAR
jgi:hypothetical protein